MSYKFPTAEARDAAQKEIAEEISKQIRECGADREAEFPTGKKLSDVIDRISKKHGGEKKKGRFWSF